MKEINYNALSQERTSLLQDQLNSRLMSRGVGNARPDSLRYNVLNSVIYKKYDVAKMDLENYFKTKDEYVELQEKCGRYIEHCYHLISAIKKKRDFPGISSLPIPKQHELFEAVIDHFDELAHYIKRVEAMSAEAQINDLRSTVFVLKSLSYSIGLIFMVSLLMSLVETIYGSYDMLMMDVAKDFTDWIFNLTF